MFWNSGQSGDLRIDAVAREIFQLFVVLVEARLRALGGMELKIEIEIVIHQIIEGSLGRRGLRTPPGQAAIEENNESWITRQSAGVTNRLIIFKIESASSS